MKNSLPYLLFIFCLWNCQQENTNTYNSAKDNLIQYVDPFIGTGEHGHTYPGATTPFGMVQLSPDTRLLDWDASSGYHYSDSTIYGFSHNHLSGTGVGDMGDFLILPFTGEAKDSLLAYFDKPEESAKVGYYQVKLKNFGVNAELTATPRTGMHRYTYFTDASPRILLDLAHVLQPNWGHQCLSSELTIIDNQTIQGKRITSGWAYDHPTYFYLKSSKPFKTIKAMDGNKPLVATEKTLQGKDVRVWLEFEGEDISTVLIKIGISSVSEEGAKLNLEQENPNWDFEAIQARAERAWEKELRKIEIETPYLEIKQNFYTALYHCMLAPVLAQDVDGRYRGMDKKIYQAPEGYTNYSVYSLWDTFRAFHPLMTIIDRQRSQAWVNNLLQKYKEGGVIPKWELASNYTATMVGYPSVSVIIDAISKGIEVDVDLALEAAIVSSNYNPELSKKIVEPRATMLLPKHLYFIENKGFIPADSISESVSYGLECAYYDWCIAQIAEYANNPEAAARYKARAKQYQAYFDTEIGFMRGKLANGKWKTPFDPYRSELAIGDFVEGNSWQWMWFVPHDLEEYIRLMGGASAFEQKLDELFSTSSTLTGENVPHDISGLIGQYAHGNEPSHHVAYLYNYVGQPQKAQHILDQILRTLYAPTPEGISGNEDCGAMSAWYVMSALGFYQVCPGKPEYTIGRPLVDAATIHLENGKTIYFKVNNNQLDHKLVEKVSVNGKVLTTPFFQHEDIAKGGKVEFWME